MTPTNSIDTKDDHQLEPLAETLISLPTHDPLSSPFNTKTSGGIGSPEPLITKQPLPEAENSRDSCDRLEALELRIQDLELQSRLSQLQIWGNTRQVDHNKYLDSLLNNLGNTTTVPIPSGSQARTTEAPKRHVKEAFEVPSFIHDFIFITVPTILVLFALGLYSILQPFAMHMLFQ
ncbi:uncharacterized protein FFB14_15305 [Fusarium fujikuroi]|nr:uncharacterized protein FFB14_15305 [Fusarium fujikuroi]